MRPQELPPDAYQHGDRSAASVRGTLLGLVLEFVLAGQRIQGVQTIALVGSLATEKERPKDADLLVSIGENTDLDELARLGRRLKGRAQGLNSGADIFLANSEGRYIGRICHFRQCHPRVRCAAQHCGARAHLNDDLDVVLLSLELIANPPIRLVPTVLASGAVPADVEAALLQPLRDSAARQADRPSADR